MYTLRTFTRKKLFLIVLFMLVLYIFGAFHHLFERDFYTEFNYPYNGDIEPFIQSLRNNEKPSVEPINSYIYNYSMTSREKCENVEDLLLVYLVKSAPDHFNRRIAIRSTWGYEHRFSDVQIRTIFLIGHRDHSKLQKELNNEYLKFKDLVQANFTDSYYNNTYKSVMGLQWSVKFCSRAKFYMFVDDDYYVSTKNVLKFIRYPTNYPQYLLQSPAAKMPRPHRKLTQFDLNLDDEVRLYTGFVFKSAPLRHMISKWYVSLDEYPYHLWPPYVTAGAYILSREALKDMYYATFYTKHFRFDDIYFGLLAYKTKIEPFHCDEFYYYKKSYSKLGYKFTIATHGFDDPDELVRIWNEQRSSGHEIGRAHV